MGPKVRRLTIGLYSPFFGTTIGGGEKYFGVTAEALRDGFPQHRIEIVSPVRVEVEQYERMLDLDLRGIGLKVGDLRPPELGRRIRRIPVARRYARLYLDGKAVDWTRAYDLFLAMVYVLPVFSKARKSVILCQFPYTMWSEPPHKSGFPSLLYRAYTAPYFALRRLWLGKEADTFDLVICQSEYVRKWVRRYWDRNSLVVHPPVDVPEDDPDLEQKDRIILSVGRFFVSGHSKRQDVMVRVFRELCDEGLSGWELHLVGSLQRSNRKDVRYLERVKKLAAGYPVRIHVDASLSEVCALYRRASIYWHAAGYGVDEDRRPIDVEHFGMTTAEAMGYGAVPIVIGRGGQVEIVRDGISGYLWRDIEELKARTLALIEHPERMRRMAQAARAASGSFSRAEFKSRMVEALRPLVAQLEGQL